MKNFKLILPYLLATFLLILLDRITKILADVHLVGKGVVKVLGNFFILIYSQNRGAFLSLGNELGPKLWFFAFVLIPIGFIVGLTVIVYGRYRENQYYLRLWTLFFAGAVGNITDRIIYGKVTDFMNLGLGSFIRSGIFNMADLYIVILIGMVLYHEIKARKSRIRRGN
jgi:signal peptidase II